ncbi:MAG: hypothetical protein GAK31_03876 [Stenotrophomonas maltophilia]|uniref:DUF2345 domain-containing protein n=1 Tax=Stenotrophomonas maltophilia TaxID=40324 RepID=A0A7V8FD10_STEMA|nr:MAG: hypothetical protein GAK31_03876 [Stenotrophomonas maltophilia]
MLAQTKVVLQAGSSAITLEGGNITFSCPGEFKVKAGEHPFMGGESSQPPLTALPLGLTPRALDLKYAYKDLKPVVGAPFRVMFDNGSSAEGKLDDKGEARIENPPGPGKVFFGYDQREAFAYPQRPANPIFGFVPTSPEDARQALERYAKAENEYMEDNYFPVEVAAIYSGEESYDDLVNAYDYFGELEEAHAGDGTPGEHREIVLDEQGKDAGESA